MRVLQTPLLVAGSTALGAVSSVVLIYVLARALLPAPRGELNYGVAVAFFGLLVCGGALGAIAGFMTSLTWSSTANRADWRPVTWLGVALCFATPRYNASWLLAIHAALMIAGCATAGGLLTTAVSPLLKRQAHKPDGREGRGDTGPRRRSGTLND